jgi:hypothetical protein
MTTKREILKTIYDYGFGCSGNSNKEIELYSLMNCELFSFRFGKDTNPNKDKIEKALNMVKKRKSNNALKSQDS